MNKLTKSLLDVQLLNLLSDHILDLAYYLLVNFVAVVVVDHVFGVDRVCSLAVGEVVVFVQVVQV